MPGECLFVWKQDAPFTPQGFNSLLACRPRLQEVQRGVETAGDKRLEFGDPEACLLLDGDLKTAYVSK